VSDSSENVGTAPTGQESIGAADAPVKKKNSFLRTFGGIIFVAILGLGYWFFVGRNSVDNAKVGDCMPAKVADAQMTSLDGVSKVDCTSAEAAFKVLGIVNGKTSAEFDADKQGTMCAPWPTWENALWSGEKDKAGDVFCLEPVKH
jgi:hypothetical protein